MDVISPENIDVRRGSEFSYVVMDCDAILDGNNNVCGESGDGGNRSCGDGAVIGVVCSDSITGKPERKTATDLPESEGKICFFFQEVFLWADANS